LSSTSFGIPPCMVGKAQQTATNLLTRYLRCGTHVYF
jgi:hypothetical protein